MNQSNDDDDVVVDGQPSDDEAWRDEIIDLLKSGQKIAAIRLYREHTGAGLKDSKEIVEGIAEQHNITVPVGKGCAGILLMLTVVTGTGLMLVCSL